MPSEKPQEKARLHPRNKNRERYDLEALKTSNPKIKDFIKPNQFGVESIDFSNPQAVKLLNTALLNHYYGIKNWEFPDENLCPPIPGRADYIHHIADLLGDANSGTVPTGDKISCFDIGIGASCIYPIIGVTEYGWQFFGSDIDPKSIASAQHIINSNTSLRGKVEVRLQKSARDIFRGVLSPQQKIDIVISNPPFHSSIEEAQKGTRRKIKNLSGKKVKTPELNFSGVNNELIYDGGESRFIENMIWESRKLSKNCFLFSTLVSKESNLKRIYKLLEKVEAYKTTTIPMGTGNKSSRIVTWTFLSDEEQKEWVKTKW
ncbi:23S rRNA (adenine(1618)-N(6))-methyltransferase RlmF [Zobellia roscoffensis]|uniref:23S rRNA (adenine(1618)-N(6))-methyltransferase RlmF n=1 Tax=Zobellia roscoffensis TaxID=2779508 RepID=UPI00188AAFA5|nr:23S rRNA (adenine(1618)-N(6))-methyltransferase RlmF [Zobellia roscoffensis]